MIKLYSKPLEPMEPMEHFELLLKTVLIMVTELHHSVIA